MYTKYMQKKGNVPIHLLNRKMHTSEKHDINNITHELSKQPGK